MTANEILKRWSETEKRFTHDWEFHPGDVECLSKFYGLDNDLIRQPRFRQFLNAFSFSIDVEKVTEPSYKWGKYFIHSTNSGRGNTWGTLKNTNPVLVDEVSSFANPTAPTPVPHPVSGDDFKGSVIMTEQAKPFTYEQYRYVGWSKGQLIDAGYAVPKSLDYKIAPAWLPVIDYPEGYECIYDDQHSQVLVKTEDLKLLSKNYYDELPKRNIELTEGELKICQEALGREL